MDYSKIMQNDQYDGKDKHPMEDEANMDYSKSFKNYPTNGSTEDETDDDFDDEDLQDNDGEMDDGLEGDTGGADLV